MRKAIQPILLICLALGFTACQEVIDVDLNDANPVLVIEGNLNAGTDAAEIKLTRTRSFFAVEEAEFVNNATVTLNVDGAISTLTPQGNGIYADMVPVQAGQTVTLTVDDGGEVHTSVVEVPVLVELDSLTQEEVEETSLFDGGWFVTLNFTDPGGIDNYYRIKMYENDSLYDGPEDIQVGDDQFIDGLLTEIPLFYFFQAADSVAGTPADVVRIETWNITKGTFDYYDTLFDIVVNQGGGSTAAPANPTSNISGGALGVFNVFQSDTLEIVIGE